MIIALDVHYRPNRSIAAGVLFQEWTSDSPFLQVYSIFEKALPYEPGHFFKRELPFLMQLLSRTRKISTFDIVIVDGFVWLGNEKPGLGGHLYFALDQQTPVIGVAKSKLKRVEQALAIFRGNSMRPLYVTAAGMHDATAAEYIRMMHGAHRIPTMLKLADTLSRRGISMQPSNHSIQEVRS